MMSKQQNNLFNIPCSSLKGVGQRINEYLGKLNIHTLRDLLFHLPIRYQDRTQLTPIISLRPQQWALIEGEIIEVRTSQGRRKSLICYLQDDSGCIAIRFFHFSVTQAQQLAKGTRLRCFAEVKPSFSRTQTRLDPLYEMVHPEYTAINRVHEAVLEAQLTPVYSTTEGLSQTKLRQLCQQALHMLESCPLIDPLAEHIDLQSIGFPPLNEAVRFVHQPDAGSNIDLLITRKHPACQRLIFDELLNYYLRLQQFRKKIQSMPAPTMLEQRLQINEFISRLPFQLTQAQLRVLNDILGDLAQPKMMLRLVQGDVGSGKTVIAALAMLHVVASGYQAALMAPTEILVEQHCHNLRQWLQPFGLEVGYLTGTQTAAEKRNCLARLAAGELQIVVGTHALIQKQVEFKKLALVVIDEQHRFGVQQRLTLRNKGENSDFYPHQLIMTATPIPRTLAMAAYADLDLSVIDELPPGRMPIKTVALSNERRDEVIARIRQACQQQRQVYWVCTLVEESEVLQCQAAEVCAEELKHCLPELNIGLIHGRMKSAEKEQVMAGFSAGQINLLVATTVIEVGMDVPNASVIIIENPERLGLAQLHQLRGRVGRGQVDSYCLLMYQSPLTEQAKQRLGILRDSQDGFIIAQKDLELRGPGEVLGTRQAGLLQFQVADLIRDQHLIPKVQELTQRLRQNN